VPVNRPCRSASASLLPRSPQKKKKEKGKKRGGRGGEKRGPPRLHPFDPAPPSRPGLFLFLVLVLERCSLVGKKKKKKEGEKGKKPLFVLRPRVRTTWGKKRKKKGRRKRLDARPVGDHRGVRCGLLSKTPLLKKKGRGRKKGRVVCL